MHCEHEFERQPATPPFTDAGIIPGGDCWVVPTDAFLKLWESPAGEDLRKQGFGCGMTARGSVRPRTASSFSLRRHCWG